jgi:Flp pilus assembly protein TadG
MRAPRVVTPGCAAAKRDDGAAAVELALVLPILLLLIFGIIDFGRLYFAQITLTDAAREGARVLALEGASGSGYTTAQADADAKTRVQDAVTGVDSTVTVTTGTCTAGQPVTVKASTSFTFLTPLPNLAGFLGISTVTGTGVMRCGG